MNGKGNEKSKKRVLFLVIVVVLGMFLYQMIKVIFLENEKTVVSILVLNPISDSKTFEKEVRKHVKVNKGEKVLIQSIDAQIEANYAIATTWIRAKTADVIIGEEEVITKYAEMGYLKQLSEKDKLSQKSRYHCVLSEYSDKKNIEKEWFGIFVKEIPGLNGEEVVASLAANVVNEENALKLLRAWEE